MKGLCVIPISVFIESPPERPKRFKPQWFGADDYITQKWMISKTRNNHPMFDIGADGRGRLWMSPRGMRNG